MIIESVANMAVMSFRKGRVFVQSTQRKDGKVVAFAQSRSNASKFRHDYPLTNELRNELLGDVYTQFTNFVLREEYMASQPFLREFMESYDLEEEKSYALEFNLFWSKVLYTACHHKKLNYISHFIARNIQQDRQRSPLIYHWLREWEKAVPNFYRIDFKYNHREWLVTNLLTDEIVEVMVRDTHTIPALTGEIVMGTLIPIGNRIYFPIVDFYHFDFSVKEEITVHLQKNYHQYIKESPFYEAFFRILSEVLEMEQVMIRGNHRTIAAY